MHPQTPYLMNLVWHESKMRWPPTQAWRDFWRVSHEWVDVDLSGVGPAIVAELELSFFCLLYPLWEAVDQARCQNFGRIIVPNLREKLLRRSGSGKHLGGSAGAVGTGTSWQLRDLVDSGEQKAQAALVEQLLEEQAGTRFKKREVSRRRPLLVVDSEVANFWEVWQDHWRFAMLVSRFIRWQNPYLLDKCERHQSNPRNNQKCLSFNVDRAMKATLAHMDLVLSDRRGWEWMA